MLLHAMPAYFCVSGCSYSMVRCGLCAAGRSGDSDLVQCLAAPAAVLAKLGASAELAILDCRVMSAGSMLRGNSMPW